MKTLKLIFASLFRNDAAMEGRFQKWYLAAILFLLSVIVATLPPFVSALNKNGSDFISGTLYSTEIGLQRFAEKIVDEDVDLVIVIDDVGHRLDNTSADWDATFTSKETHTFEEVAYDFHYFSYQDHQNDEKFRVYFQGTHSDALASDFLTKKLAATNSEATPNTNIVSFMFLAKYTIRAYIYNPAGVAAGTIEGGDYAGAMQGDYRPFAAGYNLQDLALLDQYGNPIIRPTIASSGSDYAEYQEKLLDNWKAFFDASFENIKIANMWVTTGLMLITNTALGLVMGLLIFVMTRGKNNPNRTMKFTESFKIASWLLLSPAILSLLIGLIFPSNQFATMSFVLLVGLRMMWLSSKTLRPPLEPLVARAPKK